MQNTSKISSKANQDQARASIKAQLFETCGAVICRSSDDLSNADFFCLIRKRLTGVLTQLDTVQFLPSTRVLLEQPSADFGCQTDSFNDLYANQEFIVQSCTYLQRKYAQLADD